VIRAQCAAPWFIEIFRSGFCMASSARGARRVGHVDRVHGVSCVKRTRRAEDLQPKTDRTTAPNMDCVNG
jgi:hypothetical protein